MTDPLVYARLPDDDPVPLFDWVDPDAAQVMLTFAGAGDDDESQAEVRAATHASLLRGLTAQRGRQAGPVTWRIVAAADAADVLHDSRLDLPAGIVADLLAWLAHSPDVVLVVASVPWVPR